MSTPSLDLRQPRQFLFCKVEFYLQRHYTSRAHLLRLAKLCHAKPLDSILRMEFNFRVIMSGVLVTSTLPAQRFRALFPPAESYPASQTANYYAFDSTLHSLARRTDPLQLGIGMVCLSVNRK